MGKVLKGYFSSAFIVKTGELETDNGDVLRTVHIMVEEALDIQDI